MRAGRTAVASMLALAALWLAGCQDVKTEYAYPDHRYGRRDPTGSNKPVDSVFGPGGGLSILGGNRAPAESGGAGLGVNSFLWRASLDTIAFMPLASADPFGGVIITDWFSPSETPNERFKMTVYILARQLRSDGLKVAVFRQVRGPGSDWQDAAVATQTATDLENAILTRARQLRLETVQG
ncbi:MAG: DUF3576 domain-containing protein [Alphaproteobacteria bacterium]|nr:DUF3576 domain-containing protein [Alphaproteobacteria bacterium]